MRKHVEDLRRGFYTDSGRRNFFEMGFKKVLTTVAGLLAILGICSPGSAQPGGHLRTVSTPVAVMAAPRIESEVRLILQPGDWVRVDLIGNNWATVYDKPSSTRKPAAALGYVYAPLLQPYSHYMENVWESVQENERDPRISLSEEFCKLDFDYNQSVLGTIVPQLSRVPSPHIEDLPDMLRRRTIRVLTTYAPSTYFIARGSGAGFEYRLLKDYERSLNQPPRYGTLPIVLEWRN